MKRKFILSYTVFADTETEAYDELSSSILYDGMSSFSIKEVKPTKQEIKNWTEEKFNDYNTIIKEKNK